MTEREEKYCSLCSGIIGSNKFKTFHDKNNKENKDYYHIYCYNLMKVHGLIAIKQGEVEKRSEIILVPEESEYQLKSQDLRNKIIALNISLYKNNP